MGQAAIWIKYINAWFPNFLLSSFHLFRPCLSPQSCSHPDPIRGQNCLGTIRTILTTDVTDSIWIKDKSLIPGFPISSFPISSFPAIAPILNLNSQLQLAH